ncbi:hypothetical protein BDV27DRAFT_47627 [Aspergillus caelatus]|uniref:Zn(2)-C6 fungal-type domain-containing protein n=1 Tax=Aspergillus caelatus TaxID=61420 RepID=A0A5N6ZRP2_9EURO|nr:uncharacterized protein BDV27DRAFT_47627 [Aspergillus caelatus]KAE8359883.1 hypothetical protein BDV27DRAFT_47627 [Aspergillus caelatus]
MVYRGKPSTGCQNCRSRHIKCDETRPHCKACIRTGRTCPGYPHPLDVMLRDRTAFQRKKSNVSKTRAVKSTKCKEGSKELSPPLTASGTSTSPSTASTTSSLSFPEVESSPVSINVVRALNPSVPSTLPLPLESTVTSLFFNSYLYQPRDPLIRIGFMELLPDRYFNARPGTPLYLGTLAVSLFSVSAWTGNRSFLGLAEQFFVRALSKTRVALQGNLGKNMFETIMAVLLLSVYEEFSAVKEHRIAAKTHLQGAIALVNSGYMPPSEDANSQIVTNSIQCQIIKASTGPAYPTIEMPDVWPMTAPIPQSASSQLTAAATELVNLRQVWDKFTSQPELYGADEINHIYSMAMVLDSKLCAWTWALPQHWAPVPATMVPQSVREAGMFRNRCDCYTEMWIGSTWNTYRESRIVVQNIILNCLRLLPNLGTPNRVETVISTIREMATDICAAVPFFLGSQTMSVHLDPSKVEYPEAEERRVTSAHQQTAPLLGGWLIRSELEYLCSPDLCLPDEQQTWVKSQMHRIWRIYTFESRVI